MRGVISGVIEYKSIIDSSRAKETKVKNVRNACSHLRFFFVFPEEMSKNG